MYFQCLALFVPCFAKSLSLSLSPQVLTQFLNLENLIDDSVGQIVELEIERGGQPLTVNVSVSSILLFLSSIFVCARQSSRSFFYGLKK